MYRYAGWILAIGARAYAVWYYSGGGAALDPGGYAALAVMICGAVLMAVAAPNRRIRFARFPTKAGPIGLDVGSAGAASAAFEEFVERVQRQIRRCHLG